mgnify:CR=1 FL=1
MGEDSEPNKKTYLDMNNLELKLSLKQKEKELLEELFFLDIGLGNKLTYDRLNNEIKELQRQIKINQLIDGENV